MNKYLFGFSLWKQKNIKYFFENYSKSKFYYCNTIEQALTKGLNSISKIYIWGKKDFIDVEDYCSKNNITINRIEDGFIRSVTLGSDLTKAYSLVIDDMGIYFDPTTKSRLEYILLNHKFDDNLLNRAEKLQQYIIKNKLSKYNIHKDQDIKLNKNKDQKVILVPGQVEDDASIRYGGDNMTNLELLQKVKNRRENDYIIYKPHPDVLAGNRKGDIAKDIVLKYADIIIDDISLPSLIMICDELHTITSLSGFEGLLHKKDIYTYGLPFYAGWGLTNDIKTINRRDRDISLLELIAATFILYPKYIDPATNKLTDIETVLNFVEKERSRYNNDLIYRITINSRNFISRKSQLLLLWFKAKNQ